jgi:hypothetical protein
MDYTQYRRIGALASGRSFVHSPVYCCREAIAYVEELMCCMLLPQTGYSDVLSLPAEQQPSKQPGLTSWSLPGWHFPTRIEAKASKKDGFDTKKRASPMLKNL